MEAFCNVDNSSSFSVELEADLAKVKEFFTYAQVIFCFIGVIGNILNLRTLQSPSLQTVPFMYIRSMAVFDLIALSLIMLHFSIAEAKTCPAIMFYVTYIEAPVINTFLVAGLYSALLLTVERFFLLLRPHTKSIVNPRPWAKKKIALMLFFSAMIHVPMVLQRILKQDSKGNYIMVNNVSLLCQEPYWTIYSYYKLTRECLRFFFVIIMTAMNIVIAINLHKCKMRRRRLIGRSTQLDTPVCTMNSEYPSSTEHSTPMRREYTNLMRSFAEKKLTVLMISICFIFIAGNVPQMIVMVLQNEAMENVYGFQVYRHCSNLLEVMNHCANFYVFCIASSEYTRAFLLNCICLRNILLRFPKIARFLASRRTSSVMATSSGGFGMANREYLSLDSIPEAPQEWEPCQPSSSNTYSHSDMNVRGILVTGNRENRQKKSLTIVNHIAAKPLSDIEEL